MILAVGIMNGVPWPLATPLSATLRTRRRLLAHENNEEDQIKEDLK